MKYFILKQDPRLKDQSKTISSGGLNPLDLLVGNTLPDPGELHITLSPKSNDDRGDIISGVVTLFNNEIITKLKSLEINNVQYFPVHMHAPDGQIEGAYSIANIIGLEDAVAIDQSVFDEKIDGVRQTGWS